MPVKREEGGSHRRVSSEVQSPECGWRSRLYYRAAHTEAFGFVWFQKPRLCSAFGRNKTTSLSKL